MAKNKSAQTEALSPRTLAVHAKLREHFHDAEMTAKDAASALGLSRCTMRSHLLTLAAAGYATKRFGQGYDVDGRYGGGDVFRVHAGNVIVKPVVQQIAEFIPPKDPGPLGPITVQPAEPNEPAVDHDQAQRELHMAIQLESVHVYYKRSLNALIARVGPGDVANALQSILTYCPE
jgi:DNA-binding transcriptional ArsR family regulator